MKAKNSRNTKGFTLVELLTVVTIIVILAGMTVGALGWVQRKAAVDKGKAQLALLQNGLEQYYADHGEYPNAVDNKGLAVYVALYGDGVGDDGVYDKGDEDNVDGRPDKGAKVYLADLDPSANTGLVAGTERKPTGLLDPFGNSWQYQGGSSARRKANPDFDLYSPGPNGKGSMTRPDADDIKNW